MISTKNTTIQPHAAIDPATTTQHIRTEPGPTPKPTKKPGFLAGAANAVNPKPAEATRLGPEIAAGGRSATTLLTYP